jgi:SAM-dependent methyltransferase
MSSEFDRFARSYDGVLASSLGVAAGDIDRFARYKVDIVARRLAGTAVARVLDFGCGVGRSLPFLAQAFPSARIHGFDPSPESVAEARMRVADAELTADWEQVPRDAFDCVFAAGVFHHVAVAERSQAMRRCAEAVRAGGSIFVFEHNPYNPVTRRIFDRCPFDRDASMIRRSELIDLGRAAGLRVAAAAYTLFVPFRGEPWTTVQRWMGWLPLGAQHYVQLVR